MTVAGRRVDGVLQERGQARQTYDRAVAAGKRAPIAEEERPGTFTLRVGNLMPGDTATITLELTGPLPVVDGECTYRFPLVVAPPLHPRARAARRASGRRHRPRHRRRPRRQPHLAAGVAALLSAPGAPWRRGDNRSRGAAVVEGALGAARGVGR
ncbi:MAG: hypothetical protein FJ137_22630 [Deltaproteobacteria bacterium]|nr:hypothetical protein [Deltaproteobacteria bacterium]